MCSCSMPHAVFPAQATATLSGALAAVPASYCGEVRLGVATDTYDVCGRAVAVAPWSHITGMNV